MNILKEKLKYNLSRQNKYYLLKVINNILNDGYISIDQLGNYIYINIIRGNNKSQDYINKKYYWYELRKQKANDYYQRVLNKISNSCNDYWKQFFVGDIRNRVIDYNYYLSIRFDYVRDFLSFCRGLLDLKKEMIEFSRNYGEYISFKTHSELQSLLLDNDTLKLYYKDYSLKYQVHKLVKKWLKRNKIITYKRAYDFGIDCQNKSFGEQKGKKIASEFIVWIKKNGKKYRAQEYLMMFQKDLFNWMKI